MHDFDTSQRAAHDRLQEEFGDHSFTLRGQTFRIRRIIPFAVIEAIAAVNENSTNQAAVLATKRAVYGMLAGGSDDRERMQALIDDLDDPITWGDLQEVMNWMIGEAASRPPTQPDSSSTSPSANGSDSTANSSSEPVEASTS